MPMARSYIPLLITLCIVLEVGAPSLAEGGRGPKMVLKEKTFDFGSIDQWEIVEHAFLVSNQGDKLLRIESVSPD
jgi:hypothetical protein